MHVCEGGPDICLNQPVRKYMATEHMGSITTGQFSSYLCDDCFLDALITWTNPDCDTGYHLTFERCDLEVAHHAG